VRSTFQTAAVVLVASAISPAAILTQPAERAFETYITTVETGVGRTPRTNADRELLAGKVRVDPVHGGTWQVSGGRLHHWRAAAMVPAASAKEMLALLRDYNHLVRYYTPEVVSSRALTVRGEEATIAMRFRKQRVITVVLDAEFDTQSALAGAGRGYSISRSTHIWQIDQPGSAQERRRMEGNDDGFLWRLNSYWKFEETREGLFIECEAVSLTRDVPAGLGWLITPIIQAVSRASLEFTLTATMHALTTNAMTRHDDDLPR